MFIQISKCGTDVHQNVKLNRVATEMNYLTSVMKLSYNMFEHGDPKLTR